MSETKVNLPNSADIYWHDGGKSAESFAEELVSLRTRVSELEANEAAYESILGPRTYNEVAEHIRGLEEALRECVELEDLRAEKEILHALLRNRNAEIDRLHSAAQGWRDISTAPKDGTLILICGFSPDYFVADVKWDDGWMMFDSGTDGWTEPCFAASHWQPMLAPPVSSTEDK